MSNLWGFLYQTLSASLTGLLLLLVKRLFLDKLSPRWQYGVWAILAARVLLPAGLLGRVLVQEGRLWLETVRVLVETRLPSHLSGPWDAVEVAAPFPLFPQGLPTPGSVTDVLFYLYAAGVLVALVWFFAVYLRLRLSLRHGAPPGPQVTERLEAVCHRYGLKPPRRVLLCSGVGSAFVCGPLSPILVLPEGREVDEKVLLHELLHLKHGDVSAGALMCILRCLHWCNPLLWYCWNRAQNDCEALCDQRVLERLEGEARRDYGHILLSMADDRYARAPGTSSMANGGKNIKHRIAAIARFKRYPSGMALASLCVAALLALGCLGGRAQSLTPPIWHGDSALSRAYSVAGATLLRPTTVAGALDTYVKALRTDSGLYLAMVTPVPDRAALFARLEQSDTLGLSAPMKALDFGWVRQERVTTYHADWRVFNLLPQEDGSYTGLLVLCDPQGEVDTALTQFLRVFPSGGGWAVTPTSPLSERPTDGYYLLHPNANLPAVTYTAQVEGLSIFLDYQFLLGVDNRVANTDPMASFLGGSVSLDRTPKPDAIFTEYYRSTGGRATDAGQSVKLQVTYALLTAEELARGDVEKALEDRSRRGATTLPEEYGMGGGGGSDRGGVERWQESSPPAMVLSFRWQGREHTVIAYPQEVME